MIPTQTQVISGMFTSEQYQKLQSKYSDIEEQNSVLRDYASKSKLLEAQMLDFQTEMQVLKHENEVQVIIPFAFFGLC